jgi:rhodanese-related sulfurtransferase
MPPDAAASELEIEPEELERRLADGEAIQIVDVREDWEREICALPDADGIPMEQVPNSLERLDRSAPLVLVCHHGMRSLHAANWLRGQGYDLALSLSGGVDAWAARIDPDMARY